jgi:antitoxin YefM
VPGKELEKMHVLTFSQARADLKQTMDDVCRDHEPAVITRQRGEPVVMISLDDYNGMRETMYLLGSSANAKRLRSSISQLRAGKAFTKELTIDEHEIETTQQD